MLCGTAFGTPAPITTATPTNGPTTIAIHARTTDGKLPVGVNCTIIQPLPQVPRGPMPQPLRLVGDSGDWSATNVPPGPYEVYLRSPNYADDSHSIIQFLSVKTNSTYSLDFVLSRGATFKGRVLDDATGKPIANANLYCQPEGSSRILHTDEKGSYELSHLAGAFIIDAHTTNHVRQRISVGETAEDSTASVPDIRLQRGGWISGRVERPAEVQSNASAWIKLEIQGNLPTNSLIEDVFARNGDAFRTDPLPPGTYTLHADWRLIWKGSPPQTWQANGNVSGIKVIEGQETTNIFIPTKLVVPANDRNGR